MTTTAQRLRSKLLLLAGVSLTAVLAAGASQAQVATSFNPGAAAPTGAGVGIGVRPAPTLPALAETALQRQTQLRARTATALEIAQQAQAAAHAVRGRNLNGPILNGLGVGALNPAVTRPTDASDDPTGMLTWQGAAMPTQVANGHGGFDVTIKQDESRAVLSWDTFNVGRDTELTFDQQGNKDWIALNRVVGQLDPLTGRRDAGLAPAPSQILGSIKADGTVLVINQNGVIFGGGSQVNVRNLIVTSLEIGRSLTGDGTRSLTLAERTQGFLASGILGYGDANQPNGSSIVSFSAHQDKVEFNPFIDEANLEGAVVFEDGADITATNGGLILAVAPIIDNGARLRAAEGQIALVGGRSVGLTRADGTVNSANPLIRGLTIVAGESFGFGSIPSNGYVRNRANGLILADRGNVMLGGATVSVINEGIVAATTSVARNGSIIIQGRDIQLASDSIVAVTPDTGAETIPQDPKTTLDFKRSLIQIGATGSRIEIQSDALVQAQGGIIEIGAGTAPVPAGAATAVPPARVFIDAGAVIDASGAKDVLIPASRNEISIFPVKGNELANDPDYRDSFLNGALVYIDPRLSGVRDDGVAWIGSPLIEAGSYYQQVGVRADELLTRGGDITIGAQKWNGVGAPENAADVIIKAGAQIDISGGWVRYEAGSIRTSRLITADGRVIDISRANPKETYIGFAGGFDIVHGRWGVVDSFQGALFSGERRAESYIEGRDAGTLTLKASALAFDASLYGQAFAGSRQRTAGAAGSGKPAITGDLRATQGAASQLPAGGLFSILEFELIPFLLPSRGGDIRIVDGADHEVLPDDVAYDQRISIDGSGALVRASPGDEPLLDLEARATFSLSDDLLSSSGLSQVRLDTSGRIDVEAGAEVTLQAGGVFDAYAGGITIDGKVSAASGKILLETFDDRSVYTPAETAKAPGDLDIVVNGELSTRGRWVNDLNLAPADQLGGAWLNGGSITLYSAPRVSDHFINGPGVTAITAVDLSGSILINAGAVIDVSGGGRVRADGSLDLSGRGGDVSLINETTYFPLVLGVDLMPGGVTGFRVNGGVNDTVINPDVINARVIIDPNAIRAHGFGGGGKFTLTTPELALGDSPQGNATVLSLDFFSKTGFADYNLVSYKTALLPNVFNNGLGGTDAVLSTQTLTIGAGQTLSLTQSMLPNILNTGQVRALQGLAGGADIFSVLTPSVPTDAWDRRAVNLTLGGLTELHVAEGGRIVGEAGGVLTVAKLRNDGYIRLPGGTIRQQQLLPALYETSIATALPSGVRDMATFFGPADANGQFDENALNALGLRFPNGGAVMTNAQFVKSDAFYMLGLMDEGAGIELMAGGVTDLSGVSILNPRATATNRGGVTPIRTGRIIGGGSIETASEAPINTSLFSQRHGSPYGGVSPGPLGISGPVVRDGRTMELEAGAVLDISGASDVYDQAVNAPGVTGDVAYQPGLVWSDGGRISALSGLLMTGAIIDARGGAPEAGDPAALLGPARSQGGTLVLADLQLVQSDGAAPVLNRISVDQIEGAGFSTLAALGSVQGIGDVDLNLEDGRFFLLARPTGRFDSQYLDTQFVPTIRSDGGSLNITAGYIRFDGGPFGSIVNPDQGVTGAGSVSFKADAIDVSGALLIDRSVADARFEATGDLRLTGVQPYQITLQNAGNVTPGLSGQIAAHGDLTFVAGQVYPTTGSSFDISSTGANSTIRFESSGAVTTTPYSAGGRLSVYGANIVQDGVLRAPLGTITLGSDTPFTRTVSFVPYNFAPATTSVTLGEGSITSVSADGLSIPYGTTTDGTEWYFDPLGAEPLKAAPTGVINIGGRDVVVASGATIDLSGGGDVTAYEFVPGTGGSYDVLDRLNADLFSGNSGLQYPDGRQVYAIVPGLSDAPAAAFDPVHSADYADLYSLDGVGKKVWLDAAPGLAAGWYTLLPARYAMLPGGMRVVQMGDGAAVAANTSQRMADGSIVVSGAFGSGASAEPGRQLFSVLTREEVLRRSKIQITSGNQYFAGQATRDGKAIPRSALDAGRLVLNPVNLLTINGLIDTAPAQGGRGAQVDIGGKSITILSSLPTDAPVDGVLRVTADSLTALNASSLLIGGTRRDNADGTTNLTITAQRIEVANDAAHPLSAPEIILAVDNLVDNGAPSQIVIADGAAIVANGQFSGVAGDLLVDARPIVVTSPGQNPQTVYSNMTGEGAIVRVANGPERLVVRTRDPARTFADPAATLAVGEASLQGRAVLVDSSGATTIASGANLAADNLAIGAGRITFADDATGLDGLVVTDELLATLSQAERLTLRSRDTIDFVGGSYDLGDVRLDTGGLRTLGGDVVLTADSLELSNSYGGGGACTAGGPLACGSDSLSITTGQIVVGPGTIGVYGFGDSVSLTASQGLFSRGKGGIDVGGAALTVTTPFIGDRAENLSFGVSPQMADLTLATTGALTIARGGPAAFTAPAGLPGSTVRLNGGSVDIAGTSIRATAGIVELRSATGVSLSDGATISAPGYARALNDAADPISKASPAGRVSLIAANGDIDLGAGTTVSVGGAAGTGGRLELIAAAGDVTFNGTLDGKAPEGGGSLTLDTLGGYDLAVMGAALNAQGFTRALDLRTHTGDLTLAQGQILRAETVKLTADGGLLTIAGKIDTSGVTGGDVGLFGKDGVTLAGTAVIDASAAGYAADDSRQTHGGDVVIGADGTGVLTIAAGATIDVSADRPGDRLVRLIRNGEVFYQMANGDQGGVVTLRAPVVEQAGADTVRVTVADASAIKGARRIELEGFKRWDLAEVAASGLYTGVTRDPVSGKITLDVRTGLDTVDNDGETVVVAGLNFLGDRGAGTVVEFVQDFDISGASAGLGGLASRSGFTARAGVDLTAAGDLTLASNWNLGAGAIDVNGAIAAGLMTDMGGGKAGFVPGSEDGVFSGFTRLTYRTGGSVSGVAPIVSLRAGGDLRLNGSLTDGHFNLSTPPGATTVGILPFYTEPYGAEGPEYYFDDYNLALNYWFDIRYSTAPSNYDVAQNSAASSGEAVNDAVLMPDVCLQTCIAPDTSSLRLAAGSLLEASVDPDRVSATTIGDITIAAAMAKTPGASTGMTLTPLFDSTPFDYDINDAVVGLDELAAAYEAANGVGAPMVLNYGNTYAYFAEQTAQGELFMAALDDGSDPALAALVDKYGRGAISGTPGYTLVAPAEVVAYFWTAYLLAPFQTEFMALATDFGATIDGPPSTRPDVLQTVVRTGRGDIALAASGDVSLYDATVPAETYMFRNEAYAIGAAAVYTTGRRATFETRTLTDPVTGVTVTVSAPALISTTAGAYYLSDGGDVSVAAGGDVRSRRVSAYRAGTEYFVGSVGVNGADLAVRTSSFISDLVDTDELVRRPIEDGFAVLGGGDVSIVAGRDVIDTGAVAAGSVVTSTDRKTLIIFGGGDLDISAGRDILGGRFDLWSGEGDIVAGRTVGTAGTLLTSMTAGFPVPTDNLAALRLFDADLAITAGGALTIESIGALSIRPTRFSGSLLHQNASNFYSANSGVDLLSNGELRITNRGGLSYSNISLNFGTLNAIYPGSLTAASITGDLVLESAAITSGVTPDAIVLSPSETGQLQLFAGGDIAATRIAMLDADPGMLPGVFSTANFDFGIGSSLSFPFVFPNTADADRQDQHREQPTHLDDDQPVRIHAGGDIGTADGGLSLWLPKQARISAGRDIVNMVLIGQNLHPEDVTRITAGRDIAATTKLVRWMIYLPPSNGVPVLEGPLLPTLQGNSFILGGPGTLMLEAGRDAGPFLNSAQITAFREPYGSPSRVEAYGGGVLSIGNEYNPWLDEQGANVTVMFGVANGVNYDGLRDVYLDPSNLDDLDDDLFEQVKVDTENVDGTFADRTKPIYAPVLIAWLKANAADELAAAVGTAQPTHEQAYAVFKALPPLRQRALLNSVYFNELRQTSIPDGPSYLQYSRGYSAVNVLFPGDWGYTKNDLTGGSNGANESVETGNLDLRLATIQTARGGDVAIFGPGGRVLAGSTVRTSAQAARRAYIGGRLYAGGLTNTNIVPNTAPIDAIPPGYEGVLTLRGGSISTFTDGDFLLNQSRLFTRQGGDITMWSSNADLNAGQGPKTSANFPPVALRIDEDLFSEVNQTASTTGAGIAAFRPTTDAPAPDVYLLAPRGTVDAGDAGVRVAGDIFVAALQVANSDNFQVEGEAFGMPTGPTVDVGANLAGSTAAASAVQEVAQAMQETRRQTRPSVVTVNVLGFGGDFDNPDECVDPTTAQCRSGGDRRQEVGR